MATATKFPTATAVTTSWTTPDNIKVDDGAYATYTIAAKSTTGTAMQQQTYGFDAAIPVGSAINSVTIEQQVKTSTTSSIANLECAVEVSGTIGTYNTDSSEPATDTIDTYTNQARPGGGSWTRADLLDGVFTTRVRARSGNSSTSCTYSWDYVKVTVDFTPPRLLALIGVGG